MEEELGINSENIELLQEIGNEIPLIFTGNRKFFIQFYMAIVKKSHIDKQDKEVEEIFTKELKEGFELIRQGKTKFPYKENKEEFENIFALIENQYYHHSKKDNNLEI